MVIRSVSCSISNIINTIIIRFSPFFSILQGWMPESDGNPMTESDKFLWDRVRIDLGTTKMFENISLYGVRQVIWSLSLSGTHLCNLISENSPLYLINTPLSQNFRALYLINVFLIVSTINLIIFDKTLKNHVLMTDVDKIQISEILRKGGIYKVQRWVFGK